MIGKEQNFWRAAFLVFLIDQVTKLWAIHTLDFQKEYVLNEDLSFHRIFNEDTIMMIFHQPMGLNKLYFVLMWLSICILITVGIGWVKSQQALNGDGWTEELAKTGLFLILGAAWGNAFDRIFRIGVVDFIEIKITPFISPIINIADIFVYVGEFSLVLAWISILVSVIKRKNKESLSNLIVSEVKN